MKTVTVQGVLEEAQYFCDSCGVECFTELKFSAWYGSKFDLTQTTMHLCDECWERVKQSLKDGFGIEGKTEDINEL